MRALSRITGCGPENEVSMLPSVLGVSFSQTGESESADALNRTGICEEGVSRGVGEHGSRCPVCKPLFMQLRS